MENVATIASLLLSIAAFVISFLTYQDAKPSRVLKKEQMRLVRVLAGRTLLAFDELKTIAAAQVHGFEIDPYKSEALRLLARRLEVSLDEAVASGLWSEIVGHHKGAVTIYNAFEGTLSDIVQTKKSAELLEAWTKEHFTMGLIRTMDMCASSTLAGAKLEAEIKERLAPLDVRRSYEYASHAD